MSGSYTFVESSLKAKGKGWSRVGGGGGVKGESTTGKVEQEAQML